MTDSHKQNAMPDYKMRMVGAMCTTFTTTYCKNPQIAFQEPTKLQFDYMVTTTHKFIWNDNRDDDGFMTFPAEGSGQILATNRN